MLKYFINSFFCFLFASGFAQNQTKPETKKDTTLYKTGHGLRLGIDISKPALAIVDKSYYGLELVSDYRISKNWYIAAELGHEKETTYEDFTTSTVKGNYIRIGANYNAYKNWLDMNNEIFIGGRYGFSLFESTLNSYTPNVGTTYFPSKVLTVNNTEANLTAHWAELQLGIKAEIFKNLFISAATSFKIILYTKDPNGFKTLYTPGFNRVYQNNLGFGFNYTISYLIPFVKK